MVFKKKVKRLKSVCQDGICLLEQEDVTPSTLCMAGRPSAWLDFFCPQDTCEFTTPCQLP